jgi:phosphatidylglycerophosphatase A
VSAPAGSPSSEVTQPAPKRKPRLAIFVATAGGLGYLPKAPGTWGSLAGLLLALLPWWTITAIVVANAYFGGGITDVHVNPGRHFLFQDPLLTLQIVLTILTAAIGVWSASRSARFWQQKDPQRVVIDEVSGQHLTLLLGCLVPVWWRPSTVWVGVDLMLGSVSVHSMALNWKYLLLGLILFRVFDIWKPYPARQAESLPGGWGIMADDWVAGIYAAIGLWFARAAGL